MSWTARPTVYKGTQMRSRMEAAWAGALDLHGDKEWVYEPQCFASEEGQYLPDFVVKELHAYVEVKPLFASLPRHDEMERWQRIIRATEPEATLTLIVGYGWPVNFWPIPIDVKPDVYECLIDLQRLRVGGDDYDLGPVRR